MKIRVECHALIEKEITIDESIVAKYLVSGKDNGATFDLIQAIYKKIPNASDVCTIWVDDQIIYE